MKQYATGTHFYGEKGNESLGKDLSAGDAKKLAMTTVGDAIKDCVIDVYNDAGQKVFKAYADKVNYRRGY